MPAVELRRCAEDRLLAGELLRRIEGRIGVAAEDVSAGGIDVGEIGAERPALQVDRAVRGRDQEQKARRRGDQQRDGDQAHALAREPIAAPQHRAGPVHGGSQMA